MLRLADVARRHGPAYLARYGSAIVPSHVRALSAITHCRTPALGGHLGVCVRCEYRHLLYHSCRHRACPRCGHDATERWVAAQRGLLLPVSYFHVVFTVPRELRRPMRRHQKILYDLLFRAAFAALAELSADERYLGGEIGALAVLHTWSRTLAYHPHVHMLVPGGALGPDGTWRPAYRKGRRPFLVPERALARRFAGKLLAMARRALPDLRIPNIRAGTRWVVEVRHVVQGAHAVLDYLGRYVHRTAIADGAILHCDDETVTFRYRDSGTHQRRAMTLSAHEFLRRFLQHVLPKGFHRVRTYGLLNPSRRTTLRRLQLMLGPPEEPTKPGTPVSPRLRCPQCKVGELILARRLNSEQCIAMADAFEVIQARGPPRLAQLGGPSP